MTLAGVKRIFKMGFRNFWRNGWLSLAAVFVMIITLFILSLFVILNIGVDKSVQDITDKIDLSIKLKDAATNDQSQPLVEEIKGQDGVGAARFKSKQEAWQEFKDSSTTNKEITSELTDEDNPLWSSVEVKVSDANKVQNVVNIAEGQKYRDIVEKVNYRERQGMFDTLIKTTNFIRKAGLLLTVIFGSIAFLIIFNTISITIYSRREEVEIMKLVGATNAYVRSPFLLEGALYGIVGAVVSFIIMVWMLYMFKNVIHSWDTFSRSSEIVYIQSHLFLVLMAEMTVGILIGIVSSTIAIRKHLRRA